MGRDKATILLRGKPLIAHVFDVAKKVFTDIMVVSSLHAAVDGMDARVVKDVLPVPGSLTGIVSALIASDTDYVFVLGCDMPFVTRGGDEVRGRGGARGGHHHTADRRRA